MTVQPCGKTSNAVRIVVFEEPSLLREMQCLLLRGAGYDPVTVDSPAYALDQAANPECRCVVLNSDRLGADAPEFVAAIRKCHPGVGIIHVAAAVTVDLARDLTRAGISDILQRPLPTDVLIQKLDVLTGNDSRRHRQPHHHVIPGEVPGDASRLCRDGDQRAPR